MADGGGGLAAVELFDPARMADAMRLAVAAGRASYSAGRMPERLYANASSPLAGKIA